MLVLIMVALVDPAGAAFPGKNGKIVFSSNREGNSEIYTMNTDGTGLKRITNDPAGDIQPAFSPGGSGQSRLAFTSTRDTISNPPRDNYDIYWANSNGTGQEIRLTTNEAQDSDPAISPDGNKIAFRSFRDGNSEIYTMKLDGTGAQRLTSTAETDVEPDWQPLP
jgi:Tol biopolymer transport system component